jgi:hypothetical protein
MINQSSAVLSASQSEKAETNKEPVIPVIHARQLKAAPVQNGKHARGVNLLDGYIICFSGPRGGMKTISLTYLGICAKAAGLNLYSNYPIKFILAHDTGKRELMESQLVDMKMLIMEADKIKDGILLLDEYQDIAGAYTFQSTKNRILAAHWARIRKQQMSLAYTSKFVDWTDTRTRDELDVEINCHDVWRLPWGYGKFGKGEKALWEAKDLSGLWTGETFRKTGMIYSSLEYLKPIWNSYDTRYTVDIWESMRGVDLDLEKMHLSDKKEAEPSADPMLVQAKLISMFEKKDKYAGMEFWSAAGLDSQKPADRKLVSTFMDKLGIAKHKNGAYYRDYDLVPV